MTTRMPRVTAAEVIKVLEDIGFTLARQSGSHKIYKNPAGKRVTVPYHAGKTLHPKLVGSVLRNAELSMGEFVALLRGGKK
jgi:predicted RNA binding protein YcfA (HicA-like mRNA interferase family)